MDLHLNPQHKLKPCPFCGGEAVPVKGTSDYGRIADDYIGCTSCGVKISLPDQGYGKDNTPTLLIAKFNTRTGGNSPFQQQEKKETLLENEDLFNALNAKFGRYVLAADSIDITDHGVEDGNFHLMFQGNKSCCYGLAVQASRSIEAKIDKQGWGREGGDDE